MSNEIYPTVLRAKGLAINSFFARIGGIIAPIIVDAIDIRINLLAFLILNTVSFLVLFKLEETYNKPLRGIPIEDETLEENIKVNTKSS